MLTTLNPPRRLSTHKASCEGYIDGIEKQIVISLCSSYARIMLEDRSFPRPSHSLRLRAGPPVIRGDLLRSVNKGDPNLEHLRPSDHELSQNCRMQN